VRVNLFIAAASPLNRLAIKSTVRYLFPTVLCTLERNAYQRSSFATRDTQISGGFKKTKRTNARRCHGLNYLRAFPTFERSTLVERVTRSPSRFPSRDSRRDKNIRCTIKKKRNRKWLPHYWNISLFIHRHRRANNVNRHLELLLIVILSNSAYH